MSFVLLVNERGLLNMALEFLNAIPKDKVVLLIFCLNFLSTHLVYLLSKILARFERF